MAGGSPSVGEPSPPRLGVVGNAIVTGRWGTLDGTDEAVASVPVGWLVKPSAQQLSQHYAARSDTGREYASGHAGVAHGVVDTVEDIPS